MTKVVVTGLGATTPLGGDVSSTWSGMLAGESGISTIDEEWATHLPVRVAGRLRVEPSEVIDRVQARRLDRGEQIALIAAREAWADAGQPEIEPERLAVVIGTGTGGALSMLGQDDILESSGVRRVSPHTVPMLMANGPAAWVSMELDARAGAHTPVSACASGAGAIAMGLDLIRLGRADVVVAGGTAACIHPLPLAGFAHAKAHFRVGRRVGAGSNGCRRRAFAEVDGVLRSCPADGVGPMGGCLEADAKDSTEDEGGIWAARSIRAPLRPRREGWP
ncbi:beta-ketoacyl synthase N-terminal-like domain-containing protein [Streptomyces sp. L2]|uniref:beta-ketoacyl-[acyl-carrier-protein] synthase family protein n=1 Tax=Streptomyces sp. L2 TaxID=2162665 RepID=UPI00240DB629|nr:beta-ketoacyl synthase N-terminal-like domain-containing protein [Streptomyces sp. L2]